MGSSDRQADNTFISGEDEDFTVNGNGSMKEQMLYLEEKYKGNFIQLHTPNLEISSQTLRDWIRQGKSVRYYLVDEVYT
ncbi:hypothetical protein OSL55_27230, partial [Escherichia coli]|nr:hypothetical protein [Escherichia coli]